MIIYLARNKVNGKCYVGQSIMSLTLRRRCHLWRAKTGCSYPFHAALRKYGFDAFEWEILHKREDREDLDPYETMEIRKRKTISPNGYNIRPGGNEARHSETSRRKMSKARKGKSWVDRYGIEGAKIVRANHREAMQTSEAVKTTLRSPEKSKKISNALTGRKFSEAHRKRISASAKGRPAHNKGKHHTEEAKEKMRKKAIGRKHQPTSEATKIKLSIANTGKKRSPETKRRISESKRGKKTGPRPAATKAKMSAASIKRWSNPAERIAQSKRLKTALAQKKTTQRVP